MIARVRTYLESKGWYVLEVKGLLQDLIAIQSAMGYVHFNSGLPTEGFKDQALIVPRVLLVQCRSTPITSQDEATAPILVAKAKILGCEAVLATVDAHEKIRLRWLQPEAPTEITLP